MEIVAMCAIPRTAQSADRIDMDFAGEQKRTRMARTFRMLALPGNCDYDMREREAALLQGCCSSRDSRLQAGLLKRVKLIRRQNRINK
jgi:hypothetical protein